MNISDKYKVKLCDFYKKGKCNNQDECTYAHGEDDLRCIFNEYCINEKCKRIHIKKYKDEKQESIKDNNKINIFDEKEFPIINNNIKKVHNKNKLLYSDIIKKENDNYKYSYELTSSLENVLNVVKNNDEYFEDNLMNVKRQLQEKYISLIQIDKNDWSNSIEIEDIEKEIETLKLKYEELKNLNKKDDIFDSNINIDSIFNINDNNKEEDYIKIPEIKLTINGVNYFEAEDNHIDILIDDMEKQFLKFKKNIKQCIDNEIKNDYLKFILINSLNKIKSEIDLFKNNYKDIINF